MSLSFASEAHVFFFFCLMYIKVWCDVGQQSPISSGPSVAINGPMSFAQASETGIVMFRHVWRVCTTTFPRDVAGWAIDGEVSHLTTLETCASRVQKLLLNVFLLRILQLNLRERSPAYVVDSISTHAFQHGFVFVQSVSGWPGPLYADGRMEPGEAGPVSVGMFLKPSLYA